jgi:3-methyladenine DNA glycosylase AlkD
MILSSMIDNPKELNEQQMEDWLKSFDSWDVCDQVCMNLFDKNVLAWKKIVDWSKREEEFVKRAAFALIASLSIHDKAANDQKFLKVLPIIKRESVDDRNYVKKAVSWALRNLGKRNQNLNIAAVKLALELKQMNYKASRWIGSNALLELESEKVLKRLAKKKN